MSKLIEFLDKLFEKYKVTEEEVAQVGQLIADMNGELNTDGEDFAVPSMGEADGYQEADDED